MLRYLLRHKRAIQGHRRVAARHCCAQRRPRAAWAGVVVVRAVLQVDLVVWAAGLVGEARWAWEGVDQAQAPPHEEKRCRRRSE